MNGSLIFLLISLLCLSSCELNKNDPDRSDLIQLLAQERKAHLEKNTAPLVREFSENFTEINNGKIIKPSRKECFERFNKYFSEVDFVKWDDVCPPTIFVSEDGSMAYISVQKQVIVFKRHSQLKDTTDFAWLAT